MIVHYGSRSTAWGEGKIIENEKLKNQNEK